MKGRITRATAVVAAVLAALALGACGKADEDASGGGSADSGGVKTGPGVSAKTITIAEMTDLTGVFGVLGKAITQGQKVFWDKQNAEGGVCDRTIKLLVKDHGYDPQTAVSQYRDFSPNVAAIGQMVGSPVAAALQPSLERDSMLNVMAAWPPSLLKAEEFAIPGATYDIEAINGIEWLMQNKGLKEGGTIGAVYFEGDYGEGGFAGVKAAAKMHNLKVVEQKIKATDEDMSAAVSSFRRAKVDAIWLTVAPQQTVSVVGVAKAQGLDVPVGGNGPTWSVTLLKTPVAKALVKNFTVFASTAPYSLDAPGVKEAAAAYEEKYPKETRQSAVITGYAEGTVMKAVLEKACENKDLSREGIVKAFRSLSDLETNGLISGPLDFSKVGQSSSRSVYVGVVDADVDGGIKADPEPFESEGVKNYSPEA
jgi:ABC-type branched-subunit amino acid transport system substrate-binding protein